MSIVVEGFGGNVLRVRGDCSGIRACCWVRVVSKYGKVRDGGHIQIDQCYWSSDNVTSLRAAHGAKWLDTFPGLRAGDTVEVVEQEQPAVPIKHASLYSLDRGPGTRRRVESVHVQDDTDAVILRIAGTGEVVELSGAHARAIAGHGPERRANELSDQCGALRTENDALLRENAVLRRRVEDLERRAKR